MDWAAAYTAEVDGEAWERNWIARHAGTLRVGPPAQRGGSAGPPGAAAYPSLSAVAAVAAGAAMSGVVGAAGMEEEVEEEGELEEGWRGEEYPVCFFPPEPAWRWIDSEDASEGADAAAIK